MMPECGITPKILIEGPPRREVPILLRQTSFKALEEQVLFVDEKQGTHTARFGEIEQRGVALTPKVVDYMTNCCTRRERVRTISRINSICGRSLTPFG